MKAKKRRSSVCNNCSSPLEEHFNYCPVCGQSNSDNNITFWVLMKEFVDNYLGLDSKMAHSIFPFLFAPGALTNRFQEGKIKYFIHPVRLYLVMSLVYFFTISYLLSGINFTTIEESAKDTAEEQLGEVMKNPEFLALPDSTKLAFIPDSLRSRFGNVEGFDVLVDSIEQQFGSDFPKSFEMDFDGLGLFGASDKEPTMERLHRLARDRRISDEAFLDSLTNGTNGDFNLGGAENTAHFKSQVRKVFRNDEGFKGFVLGNLPLMMFILIPLFAGVLKLIYARRNHLYIKHVVHALHVHSFAYLMYAIGLLIAFKLFTPEIFPNLNIDAARTITFLVFFVGVSTYVYVSFLKVYGQGWFKTLIKFNIVGYIYSFFMFIFFTIELFASFWYY